ncbi:MAG: hypothetical protein K9N06_06260 [Candidatus Cloacimonetes bacterium]|nr:hypothetical protein [Candidatus Cloacimonadota bacterium]
MRWFIILIFLNVTLSVFAQEQYSLIPDTQLSGTGKGYSLSFPIDLMVMENELYVLDQTSGIIYVFDAASLTPDRKFGGLGSQPVEFSKAMSICADGNGNLAVSDYSNDRIQIISPYGEFLGEITQIYPWRLSNNSGELYADLFPGIPEAGIYVIDNNELAQVVDLGRFFEKENFKSILEKYYSWCATDWGFVLSFSGRDEVVIFNRNGKKKRNRVEPLPFSMPNTLYGKPCAWQDGFLLLGTANDHSMADTTQTKINYEGFLGYYTQKGELEKIYKLPADVWLADAWTLEGDKVYLYDSVRMIVNRFRLD